MISVAAANGFGEVEALVKVDAPVAVLAHAFAHRRAIRLELVEALVGVERGVGRGVGGAHAEGAVAGRDGGWARSLRPMPRWMPGMTAGRVVAFAIVADRAAEHGMDRQAVHFARECPTGPGRARRSRPSSRGRADRRRSASCPARGVRCGCGSWPMSRPAHWSSSVLGSTFADSGDAGVGFDGHHHVALVEKRIGVRRLIDADPRDFHFGDGGVRGPRGGRTGGSGNGQ